MPERRAEWRSTLWNGDLRYALDAWHSNHPGSFTANTSTFSIDGALDNNAAAFAMSAAAIGPFKCALRPASSGKASKMPNVDGPIFSANQTGVAGS